MNIAFVSLFIFIAAYLLNILYITVFYHRGITHNAVRLKPATLKFVALTGSWITGLDPKAWACMHRTHHEYSDQVEDPHSPWNSNIFGVAVSQLKSYKKILAGLHQNQEPYVSIVKDLDFEMSYRNHNSMSWLPYALHMIIAVSLGFAFHSPFPALGYWFGMTSHPIQGWMVNALAHSYGYQNFDNNDKSVNNTLVAWLVFGEGFQNNHHKFPASAKFSKKWFEVDLGYGLCKTVEFFGWIEPITSQPSVTSQPFTSQPSPVSADYLPESPVLHEEPSSLL